MLRGQRPQFALLVRALDASTGRRLTSIPPLVSDGFVVATRRVKSAVKPGIPHLNDPVGKINGIGKATQQKLADIKTAMQDADFKSSSTFDIPFDSATTGK